MKNFHLILQMLACTTIVSVVATLITTALVYTKLWKKSLSKRSIANQRLAEDLFVTARGTGNSWYLMWSYHAALAGSWMIATNGFYGYAYGLLGLFVYALTTGLMFPANALICKAAFRNIPQTNSLAQSVGAVYGLPLEIYTFLMMASTTFFVMVAECVAIQLLFTEVLGIPRNYLLPVFGAFGILYTYFGGALVGLFMDQFHGVVAWLCITSLCFYAVPTLRPHLHAPSTKLLWLGPSPRATYLSILGSCYQNFTFAGALDNLYQKYLCARGDKSECLRSSLVACTLITVLCLFWGIFGLGAFWADLRSSTSSFFAGGAYMTYLGQNRSTSSLLDQLDAYHFWFGVLMLIFAAVASASSIEVYNNSLLSSFYGSSWRRIPAKHRLSASRISVVVLNIAAVLLIQSDMTVVGVYALCNYLTTTLMVPLLLSICHPTLCQLATGGIIIASSLAGLAACATYGIIQVSRAVGGSVPWWKVLFRGLKLAFYSNNYDWPYIALSIAAPLTVYGLCIGWRLWAGGRTHWRTTRLHWGLHRSGTRVASKGGAFGRLAV